MRDGQKPTPEEDRRRICRGARRSLASEWNTSTGSRSCSSPKSVSDYEPLKRNRRARLEGLKTGDGRPLPAHLKAQISRELGGVELVPALVVEAEQDALLKPVSEGCPAPAAMLAQLRWDRNLRQYSGLKGFSAASATEGNWRPTLGWARRWQSGSVAHEQGLQGRQSAAANDDDTARVAVAAALQPTSALSVWFQERVQSNGGKMRKTTIVALALKLLSRCGNIQPAASSSKAP